VVVPLRIPNVLLQVLGAMVKMLAVAIKLAQDLGELEIAMLKVTESAHMVHQILSGYVSNKIIKY
jgi:hypothetical protein